MPDTSHGTSHGTSRRHLMMASSTLGLMSLVSSAESAEPKAAQPADQVDRGFVRLSEGLVHYRSMGKPGGKRIPVLLAHAGPGSSAGMVAYMPELSKTRYVIAPDMLGNGDSAAPARAETDIAYYVDATLRFMDALKIEQVDFFGAHTGAQIGCQMAVHHPARIRRLALDGVPLFPPAFKRELAEQYAPHITPDAWGGHLAWAWNFVRDQSLYWPHYSQDSAHRLANGVAPPEGLQRGVLDVLKALPTYHIAYRAAFQQDVHSLLPQLRHPTLLMASLRDPLSTYLDEAASLVKDAKKVMLSAEAGAAGKLAAVAPFFDA